ncbi:LysR substrate-binding domain-containing protein [Achromobacter xylosoxidans]|uniref:LysR substrate-binding domain-containing protein n=1 Tax=Alcaligenes xylosoxydans xylosoxydans TaxID=85698 RepID=UPI0022B29FC3|nr:LysR substrate-binding domain-containing protein [Achromobacter xylosoxidans]
MRPRTARRAGTFVGPAGEAESIEFRPRCLSSNLAALREMARAGLGVALLPHYLCAGSLAKGDLAQLLPAWRAAPARIYAVMPRRGAPLGLAALPGFRGRRNARAAGLTRAAQSRRIWLAWITPFQRSRSSAR